MVCKRGFFIAAEYGLNAIGTDIDNMQINSAIKNNPDTGNINFLYIGAKSLTFENNSYDFILSVNVLYHIPGWKDIFSEACRVLKNGGYFIICDLLFKEWTKKFAEAVSKKQL